MLDPVNETPFVDFNSHRQKLILQQIFKAIDLHEDKELSLLEAQWVHRYGLATLPTNSKKNNSTDTKKLLEVEDQVEELKEEEGEQDEEAVKADEELKEEGGEQEEERWGKK